MGLIYGAPSLARTWKGGNVSRAIALAVIGAAVGAFLARSEAIYAQKDHPVGEGGDMVRAWQGRGRVVVAALEELRAGMSPSSTLLVLPEGASLNYWLRRPSASRYYLFLPAEFATLGGEWLFLENIRADPPDFVALVDRSHAEFGVGPFGVDPANGRLLMRWVGENYKRVRRFGAEPFTERGFGIVILERRSRSPAVQ